MKKQFTKEQDLLEDSFRLAVNIYNSGFRPDVIVGLWRGGSTVGIYVQECLQYLGVQTRHIAARTSYEGVESYQRMIESQSRIRVHGLQYLYETLNHDDKLLIVDDVFASGNNVAAVVDKLRAKTKRNMPEDVRIATLWYRPDEHAVAVPPDFFLTQTEDWLVLPYELSGLSLSEIYENKPFLKDIIEGIREQLPQGTQFPG